MAMSIKDAVEVAAKMGSAMSGEIRSALLTVLRRGAQSVGDLSAAVKQGQPLVSHHLKLMEQAGVVVKQRDGRSVIYGVNGDAFTKLSKAADLLSSAPKLPEIKPKAEKVVEPKAVEPKAVEPKAEEVAEDVEVAEEVAEDVEVGEASEVVA